MDKKQQKALAYAQKQAEKRQKIAYKDVEKVLKDLVVKDGDVYTLSIDGREFRNADKKKLMSDVYTVRGFDVE